MTDNTPNEVHARRYWMATESDINTPGPFTLESPGWMADASCSQFDPELWFPEDRGSSAPARLICKTCPVTAECLEYALDHHDWGIWAGTTPKQREQLRRRRLQGAA